MSTSRAVKSVATFVLAALALLAPQALAGDEVPQFVKLPAFMVPAQQPGVDNLRMRAITLLLEVRRKEDTMLACRRIAQIRDAIVTELYREPIPLRANGRMRLSRVHGRLRAPINRALKVKAVKAVYVFPGDRIPRPKGIKLPFTGSNRCKPIAMERPKRPR